eukprot:UN29501
MVCIHSKLTYRETDMGIGLSIKKDKRGRISYLDTPISFISDDIWKTHGFLRVNEWKQSLSDFILLVGDDKSEQRKSLMEKNIFTLASKYLVNEKSRDKSMIKTIIALMNACVLGIEKYTHNSYNQNNCEKFINVFFQLQSFLLYFCKNYPNVCSDLIKNVEQFMKDEKYRHQKKVIDLGFILITASLKHDLYWKGFIRLVFCEFCQRNVQSYLKKISRIMCQRHV